MEVPKVGERPVDRFFTFGDFGMVFGEPDSYLGKPMRMVGKPANWDAILAGETPKGEEFDLSVVKQGRKKK
jgi:hypothetical protein